MAMFRQDVLRTVEITKSDTVIPIFFNSHRGAYFLNFKNATEVPGM
jgi:hypothetical protein